MVVGKISIDLQQFWPRGRCLLKRHLPQFDKFECLVNLILKVKMSLEETPSTIPKNFNLYKRYHLKRHFPLFHNPINSNIC